MQKIIIRILILTLLISCSEKRTEQISEELHQSESKPLEVLLFGTFHFEYFNPVNNGDVLNVNYRDILNKKEQNELEIIAEKIKTYHPDKIFVEYPYYLQNKLDSTYTAFSTKDYSKEKRNEITQLAFRIAKKLNHKKIYAMDYRTSFRYDSLIQQMEKAEQFDLIAKDSIELARLENTENKLFASDKPLSEIFYRYNNPKHRKEDINWYVNLANQGGEEGNFVGAYLASEWYKRNLYMYSIIQKAVKKGDKRIMILAGSSHIAMFKDFIDYTPDWKTVELKEIIHE